MNLSALANAAVRAMAKRRNQFVRNCLPAGEAPGRRPFSKPATILALRLNVRLLTEHEKVAR